MRVMSRKAYRFSNPGSSFLPKDAGVAVAKEFNQAYAEVHPGDGGNYGNITEVPDWVKDDLMFKMALKDNDIVVANDAVVLPGQSVTKESTDDAGKRATLAAAAEQAAKLAKEAATPVDLTKLKKEDLVSHAADVHGLELDPSLKKDEMIEAIENHVASNNALNSGGRD